MSSNQQNNNLNPNPNNQNTSIKQKISWSLIISLASLIVAGFTVPSLKCFLGFYISENKSKQFEIITQTESGESLQGARIQVIAKNNPPETKNTDVNGYAKVNIPSERDVIVNITKQGYEIQTIAINTENEQSTTRTIQLVKKIELNESSIPQIFSSTPPNIVNVVPSQSPTKIPVINKAKYCPCFAVYLHSIFLTQQAISDFGLEHIAAFPITHRHRNQHP